jgi:hypothetical protein
MKKKVAKTKHALKCGHNNSCCEPPHEPFQVSMNTEFTGPYAARQISVPAGKRLIVERASVLTKLPSGQRAQVQLATNAPVGNLYFSLKYQGTFDGREVWTATESARIYGSGPVPAFFHIVRNPDTGKCWFEVSLTGYLNSLP